MKYQVNFSVETEDMDMKERGLFIEELRFNIAETIKNTRHVKMASHINIHWTLDLFRLEFPICEDQKQKH